MKLFGMIMMSCVAFVLPANSYANGANAVSAITIHENPRAPSDRELPKVNRSSITKGKHQSGDISTAAPAEPLWHVEVYYVGSSDQGWEYIPPSAFSTTKNHGGAQMRVTVLELGYGHNRFAWMNGSLLSSADNYYNDDICWDFSGNLTYSCQAGMTLAGYERYYNVDGYQSGTFAFQSTSINSPWNTEYDSLYIQ